MANGYQTPTGPQAEGAIQSLDLKVGDHQVQCRELEELLKKIEKLHTEKRDEK